MSQQALNKIAPNSPSRQNPSEIETSIATALYELETNIPDMRSALRPLQFVSAREVRIIHTYLSSQATVSAFSSLPMAHQGHGYFVRVRY